MRWNLRVADAMLPCRALRKHGSMVAAKGVATPLCCAKAKLWVKQSETTASKAQHREREKPKRERGADVAIRRDCETSCYGDSLFPLRRVIQNAVLV